MYDIQFQYLFVISIASSITMLIMTIIAASNPSFDKPQKERFCFVFSVIGVIGLLALITGAIEYFSTNPNLIWLDYILNYFGFALSPLVPLLLARILFNGKQNPIPYIIYAIYCVGLIFMVAFKQVFTLSSLLVYERQIGFYVYYLLAYCASFIYLFISTIILWNKILYSNPVILLFLFMGVLVGMLIQVVAELVHISFAIISVIVVIYYSYMCALWNQMDGLTGLYSQFMFLKLIPTSKAGDIIFIMDIDNFKEINDKYGHLEGDKALVSVAKIIQQVFGKSGRCYRIGGDEFAAIIKKDRDITGLVESFRLKIKDSSTSVYTNVSIGYAIVDELEDINSTTSLADRRMYIDKARNKKESITK